MAEVSEPAEIPEGGGPPAAFVQKVRDALHHLYDLPFLQSCSLRPPEVGGDAGGQRLRWELAEAVEALSPGAGVPFLEAQARPYNLLRLHYVQGKSLQEAAETLGVSLRQAYRDLHHGEERVATVMWSRRSAGTPEEPETAWALSPEVEVARYESAERSTDLRVLLDSAWQAVRPLALQHGLALRVDVPTQPAVVFTDPTMAQQVLVATLSYAVRMGQPGEIGAILASGPDEARLTIRYAPIPDVAGPAALGPVIAKLADRLKWTVTQVDDTAGRLSIALSVPVRGRTVLVIDDNQMLANLLQRYLDDQPCRLVSATRSHEALELAQEIFPDAILLDVMMPDMDGWELLQRLRASPDMASVPIIVCTVFNEPELAYALGADYFLSKPVAKYDVLAALRKVGVL